jgi:hypothetical protein
MHPPGKVLAAAGLIACCCGAALVLLGAGAPRPLAAAPALALEKAGGPPMLGGAYVAAVQDLAQSYLFRGLDSTTHTELAAVALTGEVLAADDAEASLLFRAYSDFGLLAEQLGVLFDPSLVARVDSTSADLRAKAAFVNTLALGPDCVVVVAHSRLARHFGVRSVRLRSDVAIMGDTDVNEYARRRGARQLWGGGRGRSSLGTETMRAGLRAGPLRVERPRSRVAAACPPRVQGLKRQHGGREGGREGGGG